MTRGLKELENNNILNPTQINKAWAVRRKYRNIQHAQASRERWTDMMARMELRKEELQVHVLPANLKNEAANRQLCRDSCEYYKLLRKQFNNSTQDAPTPTPRTQKSSGEWMSAISLVATDLGNDLPQGLLQ